MHRFSDPISTLLASLDLLELLPGTQTSASNIRRSPSRHLLQLRREVLARIIIVPALLPQVCVVGRNLSLFLRPVCDLSAFSSPPSSAIPSPLIRQNILSTGKSSNSSSSSRAAAGLTSLVASALSAAFVGGAAPDVGAADMLCVDLEL